MNARRSEALLKVVARAASLGFWDWEPATNRVEFSDEWRGQLGLEDVSLETDLSEWESRVHADDLPAAKRRLQEFFNAPAPGFETEFRMRHRNGSWRWFQVHAELLKDATGQGTHVLVAQIDVTDFKQRELELRRANRMLRLISDSNQALIRVTDERALLDQICRIAIDVGGYRGVSVGMVEGDAPRVVRWVATAGTLVGRLETIVIEERESDAASHPAARAIRTAQPVVTRSRAEIEVAYPESNDTELDRGPGAAAVLPMLVDGVVLGGLTVVSDDREDFTDRDLEVLQELAGDLAFGLYVLRTRGERDRAVQALQESERRLAEAERVAHLGYWEWDVTADRISWSDETFRIFGFPTNLGPVRPEQLQEWIHPEDRDRMAAAFRAAAAGGPTPDLEHRIVRADGVVRHVLSRVAWRREATEQPQVLFGTLQDITERKAAEEVLRSHMARVVRQESALIALTREDPVHGLDLRRSLRRLTEASARALGVARVSVWRYSPDRQSIECADLYELAEDRHSDGARLGASECPAYFRALANNDIIAANDAQADPQTAELAAGYLRPLGIGSMMDVPIRLKGTLDGVLCHEHIGSPREWTSDERTFALAVSNLVTLALEDVARRHAQAALHAREQEYRALVENSPDIICRYDREGRLLYANPSCERLLDRDSRELIGTRGIDSLPSHPGLVEYQRKLEDVVRTGRPAEIELSLDFLPTEYPAIHYVRLVPERDSVGRVVSVLGIGRDISPLKQTEQRLRESELRFRQVTENIDEVFWLTDLTQGRVIYVSPAYERVWGRPCESVLENRDAWLEAAHPADRERIRNAVTVMRESGGFDLEYRVIRPDGSMRWVHDRAFPIRDTDGTIARVAGVAEDITVRRQLEEQFRHAQKMDAVGRLAGGVAHDFNNLLAVIQMQSELLLETNEDPVTTEGIRQIMASAERAGNLTRQLLTFSRREIRQPKVLDLADVVDTTSKLLRRLLGEDIVLDSRFAPALPPIHADQGMMEQVVMNLAVNARDAMPDGGRLMIELDPVRIDAERVAGYPWVAPGRFICLTVSDTGSGIPAESLPRVFEPFFTTKEVGKGTGLGLATVFGIAQQHRGWVEVDSEVGRGSTFRAYLPAMDRSTRPVEETSEAKTVRGGHETVLLVEDELSVRTLARTVLTRYGYRVLEAASAMDALAVWEQEKGRIDLLLTDLVMPGGASGWELGQELTTRQPGLKVIYSSGYSADVVDRRLPDQGDKHFLRKPYSVPELATLVRRVLDEE